MASAGNPLQSIIMSALQARTAAGGGQPGQTMPGQGMPGAPGAPGGMGGDDASQAYVQQVSELKGADPGMLLRQVQQLKKICASMAVQNLERLPNVAGQLFKIVPSFDRVLKELQQAQSVNSAVRQPIGMGAAQPPSPEGMTAGGGF
jgi:hypothetical protein